MSRYILFFALFSLLGWIWETLYCPIYDHKFTKRGFLYGPICPIYGFGGLIGLLIYDFAPILPIWLIFLLGCIVSALLEYPISWLLEKFFHTRWWDYHHYPLNFRGRISLPTSIGFGLAAILAIYVIIPFANPLIGSLPAQTQFILSIIFVCLTALDLIATIHHLLKIKANPHP